MTVTLTPTSLPYVYRMNWDANPDENDVRLAFIQIEERLNNSQKPVDIIVDITSNPRFPMRTTINGAARVNQHSMMGDWVVIGGNRAAQLIARSMNLFGKNNIYWYQTETEAFNHFEQNRKADGIR
ncbi:MAG: hypothetical protein CUN56_03280 [Phototrophicales bacterium]|nr:MAG: hypothetical protein CUN56_03280 [Phototrophicales bacterium]RMG73695.1 MAG: hypothetical protein D6711_10370 [Chloroflexota bacterium]